jgi:sec-independent protein translocase protein TatA
MSTPWVFGSVVPTVGVDDHFSNIAAVLENVMGSFSIWHWLVVLAVILVLFGGGNKISSLMGDFAKGIKSFKKNMAEPEDASMEESANKPGGTLSGPAAQAATTNREPSATH